MWCRSKQRKIAIFYWIFLFVSSASSFFIPHPSFFITFTTSFFIAIVNWWWRNEYEFHQKSQLALNHNNYWLENKFFFCCWKSIQIFKQLDLVAAIHQYEESRTHFLFHSSIIKCEGAERKSRKIKRSRWKCIVNIGVNIDLILSVFNELHETNDF